jgi:hypothetical protein
MGNCVNKSSNKDQNLQSISPTLSNYGSKSKVSPIKHDRIKNRRKGSLFSVVDNLSTTRSLHFPVNGIKLSSIGINLSNLYMDLSIYLSIYLSIQLKFLI